YTGNGKGKTTAAIGLAIRAAGAGLKVLFVQFLKGRIASEHKALKKFKNKIVVRQYGKKSFIEGKPSIRDIQIANKGLLEAQRAISGHKYDLIILDEVLLAIDLKLIKLQRIIKLLKAKPNDLELLLTGRNAPRQIIEIADLVTEMKDIKHYYDSKVKARIGIEF
ncbi:MAG TPA: cob(I)yrinic acid a,c-diamide adenosyltransferase, partial [Chitinivibrionales bacterium]|nr:cob(I)yrinic acid a,c-diamide adenosyltransferase [Chitinivibrionales bacterium]